MLDLLTDALDVLGFLLIVLAAAVLVGHWRVDAALAVAGAGLLGVSWLVDYRRDRAPAGVSVE